MKQVIVILLPLLLLTVAPCAEAQVPSLRPEITSTLAAVPSVPPSPSASAASTASMTSQDLGLRVNLPDGAKGRLAFSITVGEQRQIEVLDFETGATHHLIEGPGDNYYPSWSPDGEKLAFVSTRSGRDAIFTADWNGDNQRQVSDPMVTAGDPAWSPDGKRLVYFIQKGESKESIIVTQELANNKITEIIKTPGRNITPRWSPAGNAIAYTTNRNWPGWSICVADLRSKGDRCVRTSKKRSYFRAIWSADGKKMIYSEGANGNAGEVDITSFDPEAQEETVITEQPGREYDPAYDASGNYIAYTADKGGGDLFNVQLYDLEKRETADLITGPFSIRFLSWSAATTFELEAKRLKKQEVQAALAARK